MQNEKGIAKVVDEVRSFRVIKVVDEKTRVNATDIILELKQKRRAVVDYWKTPKDNAAQAHKAIVAKEKEMLEAIDAVINAYDSEVRTYLRIQEKIRREEQERAEAEARKKEEAEKKKLDKKIDKALEKGDEQKAAILEAKKDLVSVEVEDVKAVDKTIRTDSGVASQRKDIVVNVVDARAFMERILSDKAINPLQFFDVRPGAIKSWVKAAGIKEFPGLRIEEEISVAYKTNRGSGQIRSGDSKGAPRGHRIKKCRNITHQN